MMEVIVLTCPRGAYVFEERGDAEKFAGACDFNEGDYEIAGQSIIGPELAAQMIAEEREDAADTKRWTVIVDVPAELAPSDLTERMEEEAGVKVAEVHFEDMLTRRDDATTERAV